VGVWVVSCVEGSRVMCAVVLGEVGLVDAMGGVVWESMWGVVQAVFVVFMSVAGGCSVRVGEDSGYLPVGWLWGSASRLW